MTKALEQLIEKVSRVQDTRDMESRLDILDELSKEIAKLSLEYSQFEACIREFKKVEGIDLQKIEKETYTINKAHFKSLIDSNQDELENKLDSGFIDNLQEETNKFKIQLNELWKIWYKEYVTPLKNFYNATKKIPNTKEIRSQFKSLHQKLDYDTFKDQIVIHPELTNLKTHEEKITTLMGEFKETGITDSIKDFLMGASTGDFKLTDLNEEIIQWLMKNQAIDNFRVTSNDET